MPFGRKKKAKLELPQFANKTALNARQYIPIVEAFLDTLEGADYTSRDGRQEVVDALRDLVESKDKLGGDLITELNDLAPYEEQAFSASILFAKDFLKDKDAVKLFVENKEKKGVTGGFFQYGMYLSLLHLLHSTYRGLKGIEEDHNIHKAEHVLADLPFYQLTRDALAKAMELILNPTHPQSTIDAVRKVVELVKAEMEPFPPNNELERLLAK